MKMKEGNTEEKGAEKTNQEMLETGQNIRLKQDSNMTIENCEDSIGCKIGGRRRLLRIISEVSVWLLIQQC